MSIIDTAKDVYDLAKKGATLELQEQLVKMREEALQLQEDNLALRTKVKELEDAQAIRENLTFDSSVYWKTLPDGDNEGPYCQRCYDVDGLLVRLQSSSYKGRNGVRQTWDCRACSKSFKKNGF